PETEPQTRVDAQRHRSDRKELRMHRRFVGRSGPAMVLLVAVTAPACSSSTSASSGGACTPSDSPVVTLAAYSNPYTAYGKLISTWQSEWKDAHDGQLVYFLTSFGGRTTHGQSITN